MLFVSGIGQVFFLKGNTFRGILLTAENQKELTNGVYFYELSNGDITQTKRMVFIK